jgi:hypothetical protein
MPHERRDAGVNDFGLACKGSASTQLGLDYEAQVSMMHAIWSVAEVSWVKDAGRT